MSWAVGYDVERQRDIGYGVPSLCDHPKCQTQIDRGLAYRCGGDGYGSDRGCGLYFCYEHWAEALCPRCKAYKSPYKKWKPDTEAWIRHKLTDESWEPWRSEHPEEVAALKQAMGLR